ncbi:hypothetical protein BSK63_31035, partial [Paenibacillus odorifer]
MSRGILLGYRTQMQLLTHLHSNSGQINNYKSYTVRNLCKMTQISEIAATRSDVFYFCAGFYIAGVCSTFARNSTLLGCVLLILLPLTHRT